MKIYIYFVGEYDQTTYMVLAENRQKADDLIKEQIGDDDFEHRTGCTEYDNEEGVYVLV